MADKRISQLIERTDIANNDVLPIVASAAITTNKVTVSTLQDWMQDNLDLGVTSVGITLGTSGTDVNVTGSPITSSGNITINIPTASATNRGLLSSADWNTFNNKQDAGNFVTLDTVQSITAQKTFTNSGSASNIIVNHTSGSGIALDITKAGNGEGLRVNKTGGSGNAVTIIGGDLSAETAKFSDLVEISANAGGAAVYLRGRSSDDLSQLFFFGSTPGSVQNYIQSRPTSLEINSWNDTPIVFRTNVGGSGGARLTISGAGNVTLTGSLSGTSAFFNSTMRIGTINNGAGDFITTDANGVLTKRTAAETLSDIGGVGIEGTLSPFIIPITNSNGTKLIDTNIGIANATNTIVGINGLAIDSRNTQPLVFRTNDSERMRITSTGNVGIGTTSPNERLQVNGNIRLTNNNLTTSNTVSSEINNFNGSSNQFKSSSIKFLTGTFVDQGHITFNTSISGIDQERVRIAENGNVGIGTTAPDLENGGGQVIYNSSVPRLAFRNSTSGSTAFDGTDLALVSSDFYVFNRESGAIILGTGGTERARVTSNGITFNGDTAAANALDDYEEGTWTPAITIDGASAGLTYGGQIGRYTKIGNIVLVSGTISLSNKGSSTGSVRIVGLPFSRSNISGLFSCLAVNAFSLDTTRQVVAQVNYADAGEPIELKIGGTDTNLTHSELTNSTGIRFQFSYQTT